MRQYILRAGLGFVFVAVPHSGQAKEITDRIPETAIGSTWHMTDEGQVVLKQDGGFGTGISDGASNGESKIEDRVPQELDHPAPEDVMPE